MENSSAAITMLTLPAAQRCVCGQLLLPVDVMLKVPLRYKIIVPL